jgi:hypothetical protein
MLWAARVLARAFGTLWELLSRLRRRPVATDPAEELRSKLAAARERDSEPAPAPVAAEPEEPEPAPEPIQAPTKQSPPDLASLRHDVHARARALSEEMRGAGEGD